MKKAVSVLLCLLLIVCGFSLCGCEQTYKELKIYNSNGTLVPVSDIADENTAMVQVVINEAIPILANIKKCGLEKAERLLKSGKYSVYTSLNAEVQAALDTACKAYRAYDLGVAMCDLKGNIIAVMSSSNTKNNAITEYSPCSTIKPLGIYAPAIDKGIANFSTLYNDSAYKVITDSNGNSVEWPSNSAGGNSKRDVPLAKAVKKSLNTVAVKCLADVGVNNSIGFLEQSFGFDLTHEKNTATVYGEDEVIGNVGLGYFNRGVTAVSLAGSYTIFANGGKYSNPKAIVKICDKSGKEIYTRDYENKQVIKPATADIINKLLCEVVNGGTGSAAYISEVETAGKTGTGDNNQINWFAGLTPDYSCAVWHGQNDQNIAAEIFKSITEKIYSENIMQNKKFKANAQLEQIIYCEQSGKIAGKNCRLIGLGYYSADNRPDVCTLH